MGERTARMIPRRPYRDGIELSVIGLGGIALVGLSDGDAERIVGESLARGVNYFDVAPTYGSGEAEEKLGRILPPVRRDVFLACKTTEREAAGARAELEQSLRRLRTDAFELYQFHGVGDIQQARRILAPGGAAEAILKAREAGKFRYLGFSAHSEDAAMLLMDNIEFDSVMFPVNVACWAHGFGPRVIERARREGRPVLALKVFALRRWAPGEKRSWPKCWYKPIEDRGPALRGLRFALSAGACAVIPPCEALLYEMALDLASEAAAQPMTESERAALLTEAEGLEPVFSP